MTSLDLVNLKFRNVLTFFQNGVQIAVQMCQIYKWSGASFVLGIFSLQKSQKIKEDWLHFIWQLFLVNFTLAKMQQSCEVELVHGLTALSLPAFLSEFSYFDFFVAAKWSGIIPFLFFGFL